MVKITKAGVGKAVKAVNKAKKASKKSRKADNGAKPAKQLGGLNAGYQSRTTTGTRAAKVKRLARRKAK